MTALDILTNWLSLRGYPVQDTTSITITLTDESNTMNVNRGDTDSYELVLRQNTENGIVLDIEP